MSMDIKTFDMATPNTITKIGDQKVHGIVAAFRKKKGLERQSHLRRCGLRISRSPGASDKRVWRLLGSGSR